MEKELYSLISSTIDSSSTDLHNISKALWENPELGYEEYKAHELLTKFLEKEGFNVLKKTPLETSFIARYGNGEGLKIGICCEYDALPGIGHACGHNLIAEAGIGAALGIKAVIDKLKNDKKCEVVVYGTPAEETGNGGKVDMLKTNVFDEIDFCLMSHPTPYEIPIPFWLSEIEMKVKFYGKPSHAAAAPWKGVNAFDAAVSMYNTLSMLRQQIKPTSRIQVRMIKAGEAINIIPEYAEIDVEMRALNDEDLKELIERVKRCIEGGAIATGCSVDMKLRSDICSAVKTNKPLIKRYIHHAKTLGVQFNDDKFRTEMLASTDMGNVSQIKPSIHPLFKIKTEHPNHTHGFTAATGADENQLATLNSAKSMAMTAVDVLCQPTMMKEIKLDFESEGAI